eukprot:XP_028344654.1 GA-binding protein subunit beta-2 isoform X7 [Physeter catodon]
MFSVRRMSLVDLGKRLLEAARKGQDDEVRTLMANGAPFTTDWLGTSPLHLAAQYGHYSTAEVLLRAGVSRDARTKVDRTPLHMAAADGHAHIVELLVRNGADVNAKDMLKMTALHWATEHHHRDVVELLIKYGADVHAFSKFDKSAFDIALEKNNAEILVILQEAMQNQVNANPERANPVTMGTPFIFTSGEVVNLASLVSSASTKTTSANSEEIIEGNSVDSSIQQVVGSGGQRVITIVTDGVPLGNIQTAIPTGGIGQPFIVTMQDGQQARARGTSRHTPADLRRAGLQCGPGVRERRVRMRAIKYASLHPSGSAKWNCSLGNCWGKPLTSPGLCWVFFFAAYPSCDPGFSSQIPFMTRFPDVKLQSLTLQLHFISPKIPSPHPIEHSTKKSLLSRSRNVLGVPSLTPPKFYPGSPGPWFISTHHFLACLVQEIFPDKPRWERSHPNYSGESSRPS